MLNVIFFLILCEIFENKFKSNLFYVNFMNVIAYNYSIRTNLNFTDLPINFQRLYREKLKKKHSE